MKHIKCFLVRNKAYATVCISVWVCALVAGVCGAYMQNSAAFSEVSEYTEAAVGYNSEFGDTFRNSMLMNFKYTAAFLVCSSFVITLPLSMFLIGFKGFSAGFAAASLVRVYGAKGSLISFLTLAVPYCMIMPLVFMMYVLGLKYQIMRIRSGKNCPRNQKKKEWFLYAVGMLVLFAGVSVILCIEAFLLPHIMKLIR